MRRLLASPFTVAGDVFYSLSQLCDSLHMAITRKEWDR
jgi:hypothetical protein